MEHYELVQEMPSIERMTTQERLKHARKRRSQQLKKWNQYEKQLDKESSKKKKHQDKHQSQRKPKKSNKGNIKFVPNIVLLEAAARNDLSEVKRLLESGVDPDVTNEDGLTALHQCCIDDSEELMKLLLDHNANVNACDSEMWTPLHAAATCGHMNLCKHLIDRGAELLAVNADGNMPYDICEDEITLDYIETEMSKRGITQEQIDVTRLATEHQMLADLKEFVSQGGDLEIVDQTGATLLHIASANGYIEVVDFLLNNHVCVDTRDKDSWQAVHAAAYWAQQEILELLVDSGADLDAKTKSGETPFDLCEEPDLKQKILDMKDEIETKRVIRQQRPGSQRKHRVSSRNASIRRSSMRGDKSQLFKKEHKEEALHFGLNLMKDEESLMEAEEEHENQPATDIDEVTITVGNDEDRKSPSPPASPAAMSATVEVNSVDGGQGQVISPPAAVTTIQVNKPTPKPRSTVHPHPDSAGSIPSSTPAQGPYPSPPSSSSSHRAGGGSGPPPPHPQPLHPPVGGQQKGVGVGPTLPSLKRERSNSRENLVDLAVQDMFLESVQGRRQHSDGTLQGNNSIAAKTKNGHNNNNNNSSAASVLNSTTDGQLRRFVAPEHAQVIGGDESEKQSCCVIL
ncbi:protein phosphatase 1 regulatory subunit 16A-like [Babylonia areolata]|uniref:protein phosphatase 1 regulatory subunit 16A-like n=1 Tax=Babylonia areolata TaxID=304850 RepID=UPI003FD0B67E